MAPSAASTFIQTRNLWLEIPFSWETETLVAETGSKMRGWLEVQPERLMLARPFGGHVAEVRYADSPRLTAKQRGPKNGLRLTEFARRYIVSHGTEPNADRHAGSNVA